MRHAIQVPDHLWSWGQKASGMTNPATWFRDRLTEVMVEAVRAEQYLPFDTPSPATVAEAREDRGRVIPIVRSTICNRCGALIERGEEAVIQTIAGAKEITCLDHHRRSRTDGGASS